MKLTCVVDDMSGGGSLWGEHGVAFLIEPGDGVRILFDTGQSGTVLLHNLGELGLDPRDIQALALSHGHKDHTGGLGALLDHSPRLALHAHPDVFRERFSRHGQEVRSVGVSLTREVLTSRAKLRLSAVPSEISSGVWTTGEITVRREPEGRSRHHLIREGENWVRDAYRDDMSLVLTTSQEVVLLCGCCHAGLLNTLAHVRREFEGQVGAVVGGTHLRDADEAHLEHVATVLRRDYGSPRLYLNHCTGDRALFTLKTVFGEWVRPCPAGTVLEF